MFLGVPHFESMHKGVKVKLNSVNLTEYSLGVLDIDTEKEEKKFIELLVLLDNCAGPRGKESSVAETLEFFSCYLHVADMYTL